MSARLTERVGTMAEIEHLSLYAEGDAADGTFYVKNYPMRGARTPEPAAVEMLTSEGWRLASIVPTQAQRRYQTPSHLLNFERTMTMTRGSAASRALRLLTRHGGLLTVKAIPWTTPRQAITTRDGLRLRFLGVTRMVNGTPDASLLGDDAFVEDRATPMSGVVSIDGSGSEPVEAVGDDLHCQFLHQNLDGTYSDDFHSPETLAVNHRGLLVGIPFGTAYPALRVPVRSSRFEYIVFTGSRRLGPGVDMLVRFRFEVRPG